MGNCLRISSSGTTLLSLFVWGCRFETQDAVAKHDDEMSKVEERKRGAGGGEL